MPLTSARHTTRHPTAQTLLYSFEFGKHAVPCLRPVLGTCPALQAEGLNSVPELRRRAEPTPVFTLPNRDTVQLRAAMRISRAVPPRPKGTASSRSLSWDSAAFIRHLGLALLPSVSGLLRRIS
jgi:hypothetical protein